MTEVMTPAPTDTVFGANPNLFAKMANVPHEAVEAAEASIRSIVPTDDQRIELLVRAYRQYRCGRRPHGNFNVLGGFAFWPEHCVDHDTALQFVLEDDLQFVLDPGVFCQHKWTVVGQWHSGYVGGVPGPNVPKTQQYTIMGTYTAGTEVRCENCGKAERRTTRRNNYSGD